MISLLRDMLAPVAPTEDEAATSAGILSVVCISGIFVLTGLVLIRNIPFRPAPLSPVDLVLSLLVLLAVIILYLARRGHVQVGSLILVLSSWLGLTYLIWSTEGIRDAGFFGYSITILMAGLFFGWRGTAIVALASILSGWGVAAAETQGLLTPALDPPLAFARDMTAAFSLTAVLISLIIVRLQRAAHNVRRVAQTLSLTNQELNELRVDLEQRVLARTEDLRKRASQLEAVSSVARAIASVQDIDTLLPFITRLVSQYFDVHHVGIFLVDEQRQQAVLRAANSAGGQKMLARKHSLALDAHSIVGYAIARGEVRIALDVGADSTHFDNPDLPDTRSEMAIPLRVAGTVIGALDVQSTETNAFSQEDSGVLSTLADQIAIAIKNARIFGETRRALDESRVTFQRYTQNEWNDFARHIKPGGFVFDGKQIFAVDEKSTREPIQSALRTGGLVSDESSAALAIPIKLRGQTIGALAVRARHGTRSWTPDEIAMLQAAAERAALALENARLIETAQRRAARERAIGDISTRIGAVSNFESILQTAVEELGRKIGGAAEVTLEIKADPANHLGQAKE